MALPQEDPLEGHPVYKTLKFLGEGAFGSVLLASHIPTSIEYAVKLIQRGRETKYLDSEIINHSLLQHPHIVRFKEVFLTGEFVCIVMEYANGGNLFDFIKAKKVVPEAGSRWFFQQLVYAVDYCHRKGVANRDLKLENTLLHYVPTVAFPVLKICDFGYSKSDNKSCAKSKVGTLKYMAPEVLVSHTDKYNATLADVWSLGVMLYIMLYGKYPFYLPGGDGLPRAREAREMYEQMINRKYVLHPAVSVSPECLDLLAKLLAPEPHQRITVDQITCHPWFLVGIPEKALNMNQAYLEKPLNPDCQDPEQVRRIMAQATTVGTAVFSKCGTLHKPIDSDMIEQYLLSCSIPLNSAMLSDNQALESLSIQLGNGASAQKTIDC